MTMNIVSNGNHDDSEFLNNKLKDYELLRDLSKVKVGDHLRVTQETYKQPDVRKCGYIIIKKIINNNGDLSFIVNSYKPVYADWSISPSNTFKKYQFYKKKEQKYTGECLKCNKDINPPYIVCYDCRA